MELIYCCFFLWFLFGPFAARTVYYGEYDCRGPGSVHSNRAQFVRKLKSEQAKPFMSKIFIDGGSWLKPPPNLSF